MEPLKPLKVPSPQQTQSPAETAKRSSVQVTYSHDTRGFSFGQQHYSLEQVAALAAKSCFDNQYEFVPGINCLITYSHLRDLVRKAVGGQSFKLSCRAKTAESEQEYKQLGNQQASHGGGAYVPAQPRIHRCCSNCGASWCKCGGRD